MSILIRQSGGLYIVDSPPEDVRNVVIDALTCQIYQRLEGEELKESLKKGGKGFIKVPFCYGAVTEQGVVFQRGFYERVEKTLHQSGQQIRVIRMAPHALRPDWKTRDIAYMKKVVARWEVKNRRKFEWRKSQLDVLKRILHYPYGQYELPTGWGKTALLVPLCAILPKAKIHIVVRDNPILQDIFFTLAGVFPSVGLVKASRRETDKRIVCISAGSLRHSDFDCDVMICDEVHQAGARKTREMLAQYTMTKNVGLSASLEMRGDKNDMAVESVFGPVRYRRSYEQAVKDGEVVPITVLWRKFKSSRIVAPFKGYRGREDVWYKRLGIWRNVGRNRQIGEDARWFFERGDQVLVTVSTIDHALYLRNQGKLKDFILVFSPKDVPYKKAITYKKKGLVDSPAELRMSPKRAGWIKRQFEQGKIRGVIATPYWNTGVNFRELQVLVRADGLGSDVLSVQIPGRLSRLHEGKFGAILLDYWDEHKEISPWRFQRYARYQSRRWKQKIPKGILS